MDNSQILDLIGIYVWEIEILSFGDQNRKNIKNSRNPFCSTLNFTFFFGVDGLRFTSNLHILEAFKHLRLFDPKSQNMMSLTRLYL